MSDVPREWEDRVTAAWAALEDCEPGECRAKIDALARSNDAGSQRNQIMPGSGAWSAYRQQIVDEGRCRDRQTLARRHGVLRCGILLRRGDFLDERIIFNLRERSHGKASPKPAFLFRPLI